MATEKLPASEEATKEQPDLIEQATESMLGPNPFIGLRSEDIIASFRALGQQAVQNPRLVVEQEAALIRDLISVMAGQSELAPPKGDKRFVDQAWQTSPLYHMVLQGYVAWTNALQGFVDRSSRRPHERAGALRRLAGNGCARPDKYGAWQPRRPEKDLGHARTEPCGWTEESPRRRQEQWRPAVAGRQESIHRWPESGAIPRHGRFSQSRA